MKNSGLENELEIVELLNGKKLKDLPEFWKKRMLQLCSVLEDDDRIECYKCQHDQKADISIRVGKRKWSISIKSGYFVSVHTERISSFTGFLRSLGVDEYLLETLKLYHYGDNTLDGTGEERKTLPEIKEELKERIIKFNKCVNQKDILRPTILRFLCCGTPFQRSYVTHIYHGTKDYGIMINAKSLVDYICDGFSCDTDAIHFGPFIYTPLYRGLKDFDSSNVRRYYLSIKWPSLVRDIKDAKEWYFTKENRDEINLREDD